uniref:Uncharacterized protein n=1 Tax=Pristionchus pacificus TaxID=54126 RepID=A0A2A6BZ18_PRIPA
LIQSRIQSFYCHLSLSSIPPPPTPLIHHSLSRARRSTEAALPSSLQRISRWGPCHEKRNPDTMPKELRGPSFSCRRAHDTRDELKIKRRI